MSWKEYSNSINWNIRLYHYMPLLANFLSLSENGESQIGVVELREEEVWL